jgi:hypothetical protein
MGLLQQFNRSQDTTKDTAESLADVGASSSADPSFECSSRTKTPVAESIVNQAARDAIQDVWATIIDEEGTVTGPLVWARPGHGTRSCTLVLPW